MSQPKPRVAVVFGGRSSEHAISCVTAGSVLAAIDRDRYDVTPIGITRDGRWVLHPADPEALAIGPGGELPEVESQGPGVTLTPGSDAGELVGIDQGAALREFGDIDVVLPLLHGPWGEDGTLQGMLEMAGVRYVGAGVLASAVSMDKAYLKSVLESAGLPVMDGFAFRPDGAPDRATLEHIEALEYPVFVKPARGGSSVGISKVGDPGGLASALELAAAHDPKVLVEASAQGAREIEIGVLQRPDGSLDVSVPAEVRVDPSHEFYDFEAKYLPDQATQLDVPAVLPDAVRDELERLARAAFVAVDCEGLARVDFFYFPEGGLVVNELNTMPGFTPTSMFPLMWKATGVDYPALVDALLATALARGTDLR